MLNYTEYLTIPTYYRVHGWEPYLAWLRVHMFFRGRCRRFNFRTVKIVQQLWNPILRWLAHESHPFRGL
jgi:hypothetical protein